MVKRYLNELLRENGVEFEEKENKFIIDCGGNDTFIRTLTFINNRMETWTYELGLALNIKIDTAYERIIIEYGDA